MPVPTWICSVRAAMYGRKHSFAERCEYSVRKWCSVAHVYLNPDRSAAMVQLISFCSRCDSTAHWSDSCSYVLRGTYNELKIPNSMLDQLPARRCFVASQPLIIPPNSTGL